MTTQFLITRTPCGTRRTPYKPIPNQNQGITDLLAAFDAGNTHRLTHHVAHDTDDWEVLQDNNEFGEPNVTDEEQCEAEAHCEATTVSIRTIEDILADLNDLAAEPTAEQLIADYYRTPKFVPKKKA